MTQEGTAVARLLPVPLLTDFGPAALAVEAGPPRCQRITGVSAGQLREQVRLRCPRWPGVYGMLDPQGELLYIGKAKNLRQRLLSYFRPRSRDRKAGHIIGQTRVILWEKSADEFAALHRELELIRRWRPRLNVQGKPRGQRYTYVCVGRAPAPYVFLQRQPPADCLAVFGPVRGTRWASEAVRRLNDWFRLRDCPSTPEILFADDPQVLPLLPGPGCLRYEVQTCLGPCCAACRRTEYAAQVHAALAFLEGREASPLRELERQMAAAAERQAYEQAAALRDRLLALRWLWEQLEQVRRLQSDGSFVYPLAGREGRRTWYLVLQGRAVAAVPEPLQAACRRQVRERLLQLYRQPNLQLRLASAEHLEEMLLLASWFRRHPQERQRLLSPDQALARCQIDD